VHKYLLIVAVGSRVVPITMGVGNNSQWCGCIMFLSYGRIDKRFVMLLGESQREEGSST
jgi:hypothetical protein